MQMETDSSGGEQEQEPEEGEEGAGRDEDGPDFDGGGDEDSSGSDGDEGEAEGRVNPLMAGVKKSRSGARKPGARGGKSKAKQERDEARKASGEPSDIRMSGFLIYSNEERPALKAAKPMLGMAGLAKEMGEAWKVGTRLMRYHCASELTWHLPTGSLRGRADAVEGQERGAQGDLRGAAGGVPRRRRRDGGGQAAAREGLPPAPCRN